MLNWIKGTTFARSIRALLVGGAVFAASTSANAAEWTASVSPTTTQINTSDGGVPIYYFYAAAWGATGCPSATWAYFNTNRAGAKELLALLLNAQQLNKPVRLYGTCISPSYFEVVSGKY